MISPRGAVLAVLVCGTPAVSPALLVAQRARLLVPLDQLVVTAIRDSNDPVAHYQLGLGYLVERKLDEAESEFRTAIAIEPSFAPGYLALSYVPFARRNSLWKDLRRGDVPDDWVSAVEEAARYRTHAFILDPLADLSVIGAVLPPREALGLTRRQLNAYKVIMKGFELFWGGRYDEAYRWFDDACAWFVQEGEEVPDTCHWYRGLAAGHTGRDSVALADLTALVDRASARENTEEVVHLPLTEANDYRYVLAVLTHQAGRWREAIELFKATLEQDLGLYMAHSRLADIYEDRKQWRNALTERQSALAANPGDASLMVALGLTFARMGYWSDAEATLLEATTTNPRNARAFYLLGDVYAKLERTEEAVATYRRFLALAPSRYGVQVGEVRERLESLSVAEP